MLSKHSLSPKRSSLQGLSSSVPGVSVIAAAVPSGLSFPSGLWLSGFSQGLGVLSAWRPALGQQRESGCISSQEMCHFLPQDSLVSSSWFPG